MSDRFDALRTDLAELALALEVRRQHEAADAAMSLRALIAEIGDDAVTPAPRSLADAGVHR